VGPNAVMQLMVLQLQLPASCELPAYPAASCGCGLPCQTTDRGLVGPESAATPTSAANSEPGSTRGRGARARGSAAEAGVCQRNLGSPKSKKETSK
jgi:hypothetical protein